MKKYSKENIEDGVFIAYAYRTPISNIPPINLMGSECEFLEDFVVEKSTQIAEGIIQTYEKTQEPTNEKILAIRCLVIGSIPEFGQDMWIPAYGLKKLLNSFK